MPNKQQPWIDPEMELKANRQSIEAGRRYEFKNLDANAKRKALIGERLYRTFEIDRASAIDKESRTVWMSIASTEPYQRWFGMEVLEIKKKSIRDGRLKAGAPLLVGHDTSDQIGVVEDYEITTDKKLRILARFGKSARAEEIWQDVLDGIRRNTSVGYMVHDLVLEKQEEDLNTYRVTDWEPLEGSLVPVPADFTVGVGRQFGDDIKTVFYEIENDQTTERNIMNEEEKKALEAEIRAKVEAEHKAKADAEALARANDPAAIRAREAERVTNILALGDLYPNAGGPELAREIIKDQNGTVDQFKSRMLDKQRANKPTPTGQPGETQYGEGARHMLHRGQALRAFVQPLIFSDGTKMEPIEAAYRSGQWLLATVGQNQKARLWCSERGIDVQERVMQVGNSTLGGYLVPIEMEQSIIDLREAYGLARRLARRRPMASDTKSIPRRVSGVSAYFIEEDNAGVTASDKGWGNVNLVAKTLAALSIISQNLEEDAIIDVVDDLAQEQAYAFALKEDQCWLIGDGSSTYGGMTGLITAFEAVAYASRIAAITPHNTIPEFDNTDIVNVMGGVADFAGLNPQWVCSKVFDNVCFNRLKVAGGGNTMPILQGMRPQSQYLGYQVNTSEIMPKAVATDYNAKVVALFGDFGQSSSFGDRRGITVQVLRERYAEKLQIGILSSERFQIVNHDIGSTTVKGPVAALYGTT